MPKKFQSLSIPRLKAAITQAGGWRRRIISFLAGLLSVFSLAPFFIAPILFFTFPILVWMVEGSAQLKVIKDKIWSAFQDGWWFGFGYFFAGLFWIGEAFLVEPEVFGWMLPFAVTLLPAGLAIFYGVAACITSLAWKPGLPGLLRIAVIFSIADWVRGHILTCFPWNVLGYVLTSNNIMMQSAGVLGIYGLSLWTLLIFCSPLVLIENNINAPTWMKKIRLGAMMSLIPISVIFIYGVFKMPEDLINAPTSLRIRLVQPSIPQREKWMPEKQSEFFSLHLDLSQQNVLETKKSLHDVEFLIWPEAAMPFRPLDHPEALESLKNLLKGSNTILISGGLRVEFGQTQKNVQGAAKTPRFFNSILVFSNSGDLQTIYDKTHLVPFGEYLPFQNILEAFGFYQLTKIRGGFASGPKPRPLLKVPGFPPFVGLICYEAIFPGQVVQGSERPEFLVNVTNDGWFGETTGPYQHLHQTRVRAVEEGLPILRAANNGISAVIDANGRIRASLGLNQRGVIDTILPSKNAPPPYSRWGDWIFVLNALLFLGLAFAF